MGIPVLVGGDPEIILRRGEEPFPCVGLLPGTKKEPFPIPGSRYGTTVQEDGVCLEIGFSPVPQREIQHVIQSISSEALLYVRGVLGPQVRFYNNCEAQFTPEQLMVPQAQELGCEPDQLAYQEGLRRPPLKADDLGLLRFSGGHIHVGYDKTATPVPEHAVVQAMDLAYLVNCVFEGRDPQRGRRKFYGIAGLYRSKKYGIEYRTPSNFWFLRDSGAVEFITRVASWAINKPQAYRTLYKQIQADIGWEIIEKSINEEVAHVSGSHIWDLLDILERAPDELGEIDSLEISDEEIPVYIPQHDEDDYEEDEEAA